MSTIFEHLEKAPGFIMEEVEKHYNEIFPLIVRKYYDHFIECSILSDTSPLDLTSNYTAATIFFEHLIREMILTIHNSTYEHKLDFIPLVSNYKIIKEDKITAAKYYVYLRKCLYIEQQLIFPDENISNFSYTLSESILRDIETNLQKLYDMENGYIILSEEIVKEFEGYKLFLMMTNDITINPNADHSKTRLEWQENSRNGFVFFIIEKLTNLQNYLETVECISETLLNLLMQCLTQWKKNQQIFACQNNRGCDGMLTIIQKFYGKYSDFLWNLRTKILAIFAKRNNVEIKNSRYQNALKDVFNRISHQFSTLIISSFIVTKQPPQALQVFASFDSSVSLLASSKIDFIVRNSDVELSIISESDAKKLQINKIHPMELGTAYGTFSKSLKKLKRDENMLIANFRSNQLSNFTGCGGPGVRKLSKYCLLYNLSFDIGDLHFTVWSISLPVIVLINLNQKTDALATIFWDNSFAEVGRIPFEVPTLLSWNSFALALNRYFSIQAGKSLTHTNMKHLYECLTRGKNYSTDQLVRWSMFAMDKVNGQNFTFWEWFNSIVMLTKYYLRSLWMSDKIIGFISKAITIEMLSVCPVGTFLLRYSESVLGGITIAWVDNDSTGMNKIVNMTVPFTANDFRRKSIYEYLHEMPFCQFIYPDIPKAVGLPTREYPLFSCRRGCDVVEEVDVVRI